MKRKLVVLLMAIVMLAAYMPMMASPVSAYSTSDFTGKDCVKDGYAASSIDYVMNKYPQWSKWKLGGECWGYAEKVCDIIGASWNTTYYNKKLTKKNVRELLKGIKAGSHVRFYRDDGYDYMCHSIVIFKCTDKEVIWADNNRSGSNIVDYHRDTIEEFANLNYDKITMIRKVTSYRKNYSPDLAAKGGTSGIKLAWTKTPGAKKYNIYRAGSEYGSYKKVGSTTKCNFTDKKASLGKKSYYKVKAVTSSGTRVSNVDYAKKKLSPVTNLQFSTVASSGKNKLTWKKVPGATSYKIYRLNYKTYKWKKIKTTTATSFVDPNANDIGSYYDYMVKAYSSKGKTTSSEATVYGTRGIARPTNVSVSLVKKNGTKYPKITWKKVNKATGYEIYRSDSKNGYYQYVGTTKGSSFTDQSYYMDLYDVKYYYKVSAYKDKKFGNFTQTVANSALTPAKSIKMPPAPAPDPETEPEPTPDWDDDQEDSYDDYDDWDDEDWYIDEDWYQQLIGNYNLEDENEDKGTVTE